MIGRSGQKGARNRPPRCVLGHGGVQASRAQPRVGRASSFVSIPSEVVGSQQGSPSSDQAKLRNEKERVGIARVAASYCKASSPPGSFFLWQALGGNESVGKVATTVGNGEVNE